MIRTAGTVACLFTVLGLSSCGSSTDGMFVLPSTSLSGVVGATELNPYTITRQDSMQGDITLSATSVPSGFKVTFNPSTLSGSAVKTVVYVAVDRSMSPGPYVISLQGQSASQVQTINANVQVGTFTTTSR